MFRRSVPLGVIPVGVRNFFGKFVFGSDKQDVRYAMTRTNVLKLVTWGGVSLFLWSQILFYWDIWELHCKKNL